MNRICANGAGNFWHATPARGLHMDVEPSLFRIMVQRWLRIPIATEDSICHLCEGVLDKCGTMLDMC